MCLTTTLSTSYVRGKWANSQKCHTSMLLAKCCHDLDIMMWMMAETKPTAVSSFGGKFQFKPENARQVCQHAVYGRLPAGRYLPLLLQTAVH